jgi:soluble lytic murein transglycosylase
MFRFVWRLLFILVFAALTAASVLLWLSPDPFYEVQKWMSGSRFSAYDEIIEEVGHKQGVDPLLIKALVWRESGFHPDKVGTAGERGLMQVTEAAAQEWAKAEKIETFVPTDLFDPKTNLEAGTWYLAKSLDRWKEKDNPVPFALAEYNAGRSRVNQWVAATNMGDKANADDLLGAIDFPLTRKYITDITERLRFYRESSDM